MPLLPFDIAKELKDSGWEQPETLNGRMDAGGWVFSPEHMAKLAADSPDSKDLYTLARVVLPRKDAVYSPSLSELIAACPNEFKDGYFTLRWHGSWEAYYARESEDGLAVTYVTDNWLDGAPMESPEEAVARLWLALR